MHANEINFLDVTNDGLVVGKSPNGNRIEFLESIINRAKKLIAENEDLPMKSTIQLKCEALSEEEYEVCINCSYMDFFSLSFMLVLAFLSILVAVIIIFSLKKCKRRTRQ